MIIPASSTANTTSNLVESLEFILNKNSDCTEKTEQRVNLLEKIEFLNNKGLLKKQVYTSSLNSDFHKIYRTSSLSTMRYSR